MDASEATMLSIANGLSGTLTVADSATLAVASVGASVDANGLILQNLEDFLAAGDPTPSILANAVDMSSDSVKTTSLDVTKSGTCYIFGRTTNGGIAIYAEVSQDDTTFYQDFDLGSVTPDAITGEFAGEFKCPLAYIRFYANGDAGETTLRCQPAKKEPSAL